MATSFDLTNSTKVVHGVGGGQAGNKNQNNGIKPDVKEDEQQDIYHVLDCITVGKSYRDSFLPGWQEILSQVNCEHPTNWNKKDAWQSKVFVGQQAWTSETARSKALRLLFPRKFFGIAGVEDSDKEIVADIILLITTLLSKGGFYLENAPVVEEAGEIGTSAIKMWVEDKKRIKFQYRSVFNWFIDPSARNNIDKVKWVVDEYKKDLGELIASVRDNKGMYSKDAISKLLEVAETEAIGKAEQDLMGIRGIDGVSKIMIPKSFKTVTIHEYTGQVPRKSENGEYVTEDRIITVANEKVIIRNDKLGYGFLPHTFARIRKRRYDFYAKGFLYNARDIQKLTNSILNLGMDSLVINSMDIIKLDVNKVDDPNSIEYKPLAIWRLRDVKGAELTRSNGGVSSFMDVLRGIQYLDQIHQDITGISRAVAGSNPLGGQGGAETLGEFQTRLSNVENRFLGEATILEEEYVVALIKKMYKIISDPALFSQEAIDEIVGKKQAPAINQTTGQPFSDPMTGQPMMSDVSRLPQDMLKARKFDDNFIATGTTQLNENTEAFARLQKIMQTIWADPQAKAYIKMGEFLKRVMQAHQLPDYEDMIKTDEQVMAELQATQNPPPQGNSGGGMTPPMPQGEMQQ